MYRYRYVVLIATDRVRRGIGHQGGKHRGSYTIEATFASERGLGGVPLFCIIPVRLSTLYLGVFEGASIPRIYYRMILNIKYDAIDTSTTVVVPAIV